MMTKRIILAVIVVVAVSGGSFLVWENAQSLFGISDSPTAGGTFDSVASIPDRDSDNNLIVPCSHILREKELVALIKKYPEYFARFELVDIRYESRARPVGAIYGGDQERIVHACGSGVTLKSEKRYQSWEDINNVQKVFGRVLDGWEVSEKFQWDGVGIGARGWQTSGDMTTMFQRRGDALWFLVTNGEIGPYVPLEGWPRGELTCPCYEQVDLFLSDDISLLLLGEEVIRNQAVEESVVSTKGRSGAGLYENEKYGFRIQFPHGWSYFEQEKRYGTTSVSLLQFVPVPEGEPWGDSFGGFVSVIENVEDLYGWFSQHARFDASTMQVMFEAAASMHGPEFITQQDFVSEYEETHVNGHEAIVQRTRCLKQDCYFLGAPREYEEEWFIYDKPNVIRIRMMTHEDGGQLVGIIRSFKFLEKVCPAASMSTSQDAIAIPELPRDIEWREITNIEQVRRYADGALYIRSDSGSTTPVFIPGKAWSATYTAATGSMSASAVLATLEKHFSDFFLQNGWTYTVSFPSAEIAGMQGDSPSREIVGYVRARNGMLRTITLHTHWILSNDAMKNVENASGPIGMEFKIFISDTVPVSTIIPTEC